MDDIRQTLPGGGVVPIRLLFLINPLFIMEKFLLMMQIDGLLKCLDTNALCRRTPKLLLTLWIICFVYRGFLFRKLPVSMPHPFWSTISSTGDLALQKTYTYLRTIFSSLLITGPFSIVFGFHGGLMALNDRLKLRSMVIGDSKDLVYISSEECAIRAMDPDAKHIWGWLAANPSL